MSTQAKSRQLFVNLPVENLDLLSRYGSEDTNVQLDRLGGVGWQSRKARLKNRIREIAAELVRIAAARKLREALGSQACITDAIYGAGFNSNSRFYEASNQLLGMRARDYRAGGAGAVIRFAVGQCSLGAILVAQSQRGICAILLGDDPDRLVRDLQDQFPKAEIIGCDGEFEQLIAQVVGFIEAPGMGLHLPLDVQGTAFQERVWRALREIPPGETVSYTEIAERIGSPRAVRAVAQACATNHIAVAIPCHRVVRRDGDLAGYRWGVDRKRELLRREAQA